MSLKRHLHTLSNLIRTRHWIKNFLLFAPLIFAFKLFSLKDVLYASIGFLTFSFVSVFVYIINDIKDCDTDAKHPIKSKRPLPSKAISNNNAIIIAIFFLTLGLSLSLINLKSTFILIFYVFLNILYTFKLKKVVIVDIFVIALGFCLRVLMGAILVDVVLSNWMLLATFSISLILGFGKRRHELELLKEDASEHREILGEYSKEILDVMITISTGVTAISYALYTMDYGMTSRHKTENLIFTFPIVMYGLFRYLYIVYHKSKGGSPEEDLITDKGILLSILIWGIMIVILLYSNDLYSLIKPIFK